MQLPPKMTPPQLQMKFFEDLFKSAEISNFTPSERRKYHKDMMDEQSIAMSIKFHERIGREEGREESRTQIAREMLKDGLSPETISKYTGLSEDQILSLDKKIL